MDTLLSLDEFLAAYGSRSFFLMAGAVVGCLLSLATWIVVRGRTLEAEVSRRRRIEASVNQSQNMEELGRMAGGVVHDFNNILTSILGYCDVVLGVAGADDPSRRPVQEIRKAGERAASLTRQLLPRAAAAPYEPPAVAASPFVSGSETILLAEDDPMVRQFVSEILDSQGYAVLKAVDGRDALSVAERHAGPIHLALTDVVMPNLGGPALARELAGVRPATRVCFMTGYTDTPVPDPGRPDARVHFLTKPFSRDALLHKVRESIDRDR